MLRASALDSKLYEEVEHDTSATPQAFLVVLLASIAAGVGQTIAQTTTHAPFPKDMNLGVIFASVVILSLAGWLLLAALTYWIGTTILRTPQTQATLGELVRTIGFAQSPGVIGILVFVPVLGSIVNITASFWILVTTVVAVRQALDFSTGRAIATSLMGWLLQSLVIGIPALLLTKPPG